MLSRGSLSSLLRLYHCTEFRLYLSHAFRFRLCPFVEISTNIAYFL
nr:MAG TPA: hypothetical protein [Caudoviricetes sp.]